MAARASPRCGRRAPGSRRGRREISSTAAPASQRGEQLLVHVGDRADVEAPGRLVRDDQRRHGVAVVAAPVSARPRISFCMLPPDSERAGASAAAPAPRTSKRSTTRRACVARRGRAARRRQRAKRRLRRRSSTAFSHTGRSPIDADARGGLRGCARRRASIQPRGSAGSARPASCTRAGVERAACPHSSSASACLAVARHAGDGHDLAAAQRRAITPSQRGRAAAARTLTSRSAAHGVAGAALRGAARATASTARPTIHCASCACVGAGGARPAATSLPRAQHRDAVRHAQHLVELVADEDDRQALRHHLRQRGEQRLALLRRQHRGRLVEDQDARAAVQRLQDLDALALADRQARRPARRARTGRPKRCAASSSLRARRARRENGCHSGSVPSITLSSTLRLSASVKCWCTMPMPAASAAFGLPGGSGRPNDLDRARRRRRSGRTGSTPASTCRRRSRRAAPAPRRACSSSEMASLATSAPKRLVMPRQRSRTRLAGAAVVDCAPSRHPRSPGGRSLGGGLGLASSTLTVNLPSRIGLLLRLDLGHDVGRHLLLERAQRRQLASPCASSSNTGRSPRP